MDLTSGRISPTGGRTGHGHSASDIYESLMKIPSEAVQAALASATSVAQLKAAIQAWVAEQ